MRDSLALASEAQAQLNRWWEARNLWGNIVQGSRTLILQLITTATGVAHVEHISHEEDPHGSDHHSSRSDSPSQGPVADDTQCDVVPNVAAWCLAFPIALKQHLRGEPFPSSRTDDVEGKLQVLQRIYRTQPALLAGGGAASAGSQPHEMFPGMQLERR